MPESRHAASPLGPRRACSQPSVLPPATRSCGPDPTTVVHNKAVKQQPPPPPQAERRGGAEKDLTADRACSSTAPSASTETEASKPPFFCHCKPLGQCPPWAVYLCEIDPCGGLSVATSVIYVVQEEWNRLFWRHPASFGMQITATQGCFEGRVSTPWVEGIVGGLEPRVAGKAQAVGSLVGHRSVHRVHREDQCVPSTKVCRHPPRARVES